MIDVEEYIAQLRDRERCWFILGLVALAPIVCFCGLAAAVSSWFALGIGPFLALHYASSRMITRFRELRRQVVDAITYEMAEESLRKRRKANARALLGIKAGASRTEIRRAYLKRARQLHPDLNPDVDVQHFCCVTDAYRRLMGKG